MPFERKRPDPEQQPGEQRELVQVVVPTPLRRTFDYLLPQGISTSPGCRVEVPFGRRTLVGLVVGTSSAASSAATLKVVRRILDASPVLSPDLLSLAAWATRYYHHPPGEVYFSALPVAMRQGRPGAPGGRPGWQLTAEGAAISPDQMQRAPRQQQALQLLKDRGAMSNSALAELNLGTAILRSLAAKDLVSKVTLAAAAAPSLGQTAAGDSPPQPLQLTAEQQEALAAVTAGLGSYGCFLLDGVTGSGKTEVYLGAIDQALAAGGQALVLVPEIGLTPQTLARFQARFGATVALSHSQVGDAERHSIWHGCRSGAIRVLLGTRSAVFADLPNLALVVVDEEHDASFKQQEGLRYSARDLAIKRASDLDIPVLLGSATPSLESLHNCSQDRSTRLTLRQRPGAAAPSRMRLLDVRGLHLQDGLSDPLVTAMRSHLAAGNQVLVFLNRRGFAPVLMCHGCGWMAECRRCDARMTLHRDPPGLRCHHCDSRGRMPVVCPDCGAGELAPVGQGTQRLETALMGLFPDIPVLRIDRDTVRSRKQLEQQLARIEQGASQGEPALLLGTQMLAKGHHFPAVTLVAVLNADGGLFSADFRGPERMAQTLVQVAGRAGRAERPGEVWVQTLHPDHEVVQTLAGQGYHAFAQQELQLRRDAGWPPYQAMAMLRAEAMALGPAEDLLRSLAEAAQELTADQPTSGPTRPPIQILGPVPAAMERRSGRYRAQLLLLAPTRPSLHWTLARLVALAESLPAARKVRWSLDVDPADTM